MASRLAASNSRCPRGSIKTFRYLPMARPGWRLSTTSSASSRSPSWKRRRKRPATVSTRTWNNSRRSSRSAKPWKSKCANRQSRFANRWSRWCRRCATSERKQGDLGRLQGELGHQQALLGMQQRDASREADVKMKSLIDQAMKDGKAHPAQ